MNFDTDGRIFLPEHGGTHAHSRTLNVTQCVDSARAITLFIVAPCIS